MRRLAVMLAVSLGATGCTIFNDPDRSLIPGPDAGSRDGGMPDAGDAGDAAVDGADAGDAMVPCTPRQEICGNEADEDCDGLVDCADFDCAGLSACCTGDVGEVIFDEDWSASDLSVRWSAEPTGAGFPSKQLVGGDWRLTSFDEGEAIIHNSCTPLSLGLDLSITFVPKSTGTCTEDCHVALYLTQSEYLVPGAPPLEDLVVRMEAGGILLVEHAGTELGRSETPFAAEMEVDVQLGVQPGLDELGEPQLFATVFASQGGRTQTLVEESPFIPQEDLVESLPRCDEAPGLFLALAGKGDRVHVGRLRPSRQQCVNPSQFTPPPAESAILTSERLGLDGWAGAGIGAPSLASTTFTGDVRWDVMVDATNVDRELEKISHIGTSIGHSRAVTWNDFPWATRAGEPRAGANPPGCTDGTCDANVALREPSMLALRTGTGELDSFVVAYARENDAAVTAGNRDVYELRIQFASGDVTAPFPGGGGTVAPDTMGECDSLRDPELLAAGPERTDGYWVMFTCEAAGADTIRAIRLDDTLLTPVGDSVQVLPPVDPENPEETLALGAYAAGGVSGPAVIAEYDDGGAGAVYRMWFLARDRGGANVTLAMAQAQTDEVGTALPAFEPYSANPILHPDDLDGCAPGECDLTGVAVARQADDVTRLRFLVARHVNGAGGSQYELVPLEQFWRSPWM